MNDTKNASCVDLIKNVLKIDVCTAAKQKLFYHGLRSLIREF